MLPAVVILEHTGVYKHGEHRLFDSVSVAMNLFLQDYRTIGGPVRNGAVDEKLHS
jgi:hypothetical protein